MIRRWLLLLLAYGALTAVMAAPMTNLRALGSASYQGDARLIIWTLAWDNHAVLAGRPPFDSNIFHPAPRSLAYNEHLFGLSLFTLPIYAATGNPVLAYNLVWLLSFLLSGLVTHAALRRYTGDDLAAAAGSLIYTFSFYKMLHAHGHLHLVWTWLIPASVICLEHWAARPSAPRAMLWALTVVLQALTSWYLAVMTMLVQAVVMISLLPRLHRERQLVRLWQIAAVTIAAALVIWPFAAPYRALAPTSPGEAALYSADLPAYLLPPENTWAGQWWRGQIGDQPRSIWGERTLFLGWTALALAAVGVVRILQLRQWRAAAVGGSIAVAAFTLSLGPSPDPGDTWNAFAMLHAVPGLGAFRAPARFALLLLFGLSILAAFGAGAIHRGTRRGALVLAAVLALMLSEWYVVKFPGGPPSPFPIPAIYRLGALAEARAILSLPEYRGTPEWYLGADYLYFSTAHWRPIVNGFGRSEPPGHSAIFTGVGVFPAPGSAQALRSIGVDHVVVHAGRYADGGKAIIEEARRSPEFERVARIGSDYLFRVRAVPGQAQQPQH